MPIYDKPVRVLIVDMIRALAPSLDQQFSKEEAIEWFEVNYPKINPHFPALRSGPTAAPGASLQKQIPSSWKAPDSARSS